eukprot:gene7334-8540_t
MTYSNKGTTTYESLQNSFKEHGDRQCIGWRKRVPVTEDHPYGLAEFVWINYDQFYERTKYFSRALSTFLDPHAFVDSDSLVEILKNSETRCIVISQESLPKLTQLLKDGTYQGLKLIVHIEDHVDAEEMALIPTTVQIRTYSQMMDMGKKMKKVNHDPLKSNDILSIIYTSGSTGAPKGVVTLDKQWNKQITESYLQYPSCALSFATLSHSQRRFDHKMLYHGGKIGLFSMNMDILFNDLAQLRPHIFWGVPRLWNLMFTQYQSELDKFTQDHKDSSKEYCEEMVIKKFSNILGQRVRSLVTGGAPTSDEVMDFMRKCWPKANINNSYGLSEAIGIFVDGYISENVQYRIDPVPEFGYSPTDIPHPRGELVVKTDNMSTGYYRNDELTREAFQDGWFKTGDIVEEYGRRKIRIIDRKKNAFKLSNGEFVAPEPLENTFLGSSEMIQQIFIYGTTLKTFLVAVVIPRPKLVQEFGEENITENAALKHKIYAEIQRVAKEKNLASYEVPKIICIDTTVWTTENELITGSGKYCRGKLAKYYKEVIDTIIIEKYVKSVLNLDTATLTPEQLKSLTFTQIGGDSLGAIKLATFLKEKANIEVSPSYILNNNNNLADLTSLLDKQSIGEQRVDWENEMQLDPEINTIGKQAHSVKASGNNVFLTGATGFLGSFLLYSMLTSERVDNVYCLVRGNDSEEKAHERLMATLTGKYKLSLEGIDTARVVPVLGDLSLARLGLTVEAFKKLADNVDFILHNGAVVNMVLPYPNMSPHNVGGTQEVIRLAVASSRILPIAFISTIGTYSVRDKVITESDIPTTAFLDHMGGYNQSKLVAEALIREASARGIPAMLFRPGTIFAHTTSGVDNEHDFVRLVMRGIIELGAYPDVQSDVGGVFNLSPVDWVSNSIVSLALTTKFWTSEAKAIPTFHMVNQNYTTLERICSTINKDIKPLTKITFDEWRKQIALPSSNPLHTMQMMFKHSFPGFGKFGFKNPSTKKHLEQLGLTECPPISDNTICLAFK